MAPQREITHFKVETGLFNQIVNVLNQLPAQSSRGILNGIEGGKVEPIFAVGDLGGHKRQDPPAGKPAAKKASKKKPTRKKATRRKVAKKKGRK